MNGNEPNFEEEPQYNEEDVRHIVESVLNDHVSQDELHQNQRMDAAAEYAVRFLNKFKHRGVDSNEALQMALAFTMQKFNGAP